MKRRIALLLVICLLATMMPGALADVIVEMAANEAVPVELPEETFEILDDGALALALEEVELPEPEGDGLTLADPEETELLGEEALSGAEERAEGAGDDTVEVNAVKDGVPAKLTLGLKQTFKLDPSKLAKGKKVAYKSSKPAVAAVSSKGVVTAKKKGSATITLTADKKKIATCKVTVVAAPAKVTLAVKSVDLGVKETYQIAPRLPKKTMASFTYKSKNTKIATVTKDGLVKGVKAGKTTVTVTTHNKKSVKLTVNVLAAPKGVSLGVKSVTLGVKEKLTLQPRVTKNSHASFTYSAKDTKIAAVSKSGVVTAKKVGSTTVTVRTHNGRKATLKVTVQKAPSKVTLKPTKLTLYEGQQKTLAATLPKNSASAITWKSSKEAVASVDENGVVTALSAGKAKITVKTFNGKKAECVVTVAVDSRAETPQGVMDFLSDPDTSLQNIGRFESNYQLLPLTGNETAAEKKAINAANALVKQANAQIKSYNQTYDKLVKDVTEVEKVYRQEVTEKITGNTVVYGMGGYTMTMDRALFDALAAGADLTLEEITEDGAARLACNGKDWYISGTAENVTISGSIPNAAGGVAANAVTSNANIQESAVRFFVDKASWVANKADAILKGIDIAITDTEKMIETNNKLIAHYKDVAQYHYGDATIEQQCLKAALEDDYKLKASIKSLSTLKVALGAINIVGQAATLVKIANQYYEVYTIDCHGHPTDEDKKYEVKMIGVKGLNISIKAAYALFTVNCLTSLLSIASTLGAIGPLAPGGIVGALGMMVLSDGLGKSADAAHKSVKDFDDSIHKPIYGVVMGRVMDEETQRPLGGVEITVSADCEPVTTDAGGYYTIEEVPVGDTLIGFSKYGYGYATQRVTVVVDKVTQPEVQYLKKQYGTVKGAVYDEETKKPIYFASVIAPDDRQVMTDGYGQFVLENVPVGENQIQFEKKGYSKVVETVKVTAEPGTPLKVYLALRSGTVSGTVSDEATGKALDGVTVSCEGCEAVTTDADGKYTLKKVPEGENKIYFSKTGYVKTGMTLKLSDGDSKTQDATLKKKVGTVSGTVRDKDTNLFLSGVTVSCEGISTTTDALGKYTLENVPEGEHEVTFALKDYGTIKKTATVKADENTTLDATLKKKVGTVSGTVRDKDTEQRLSGVTVSCEGCDAVTTGSDGTYTLENVPEGVHEVTFALAGYGTVKKSATVVADQKTPLDATLRKGAGTVSGTVREKETDSVLSGVTVSCEGCDSVTTNSNGEYTLTSVPIGENEITFTMDGYCPMFEFVVVEDSTTMTLDTYMMMKEKVGSFEGTVLDVDTGEPLSNVWVYVEGCNWGWTDSDGKYNLENIPVGTYPIVFELEDYDTVYDTVTVTEDTATIKNVSIKKIIGKIEGVVRDIDTNEPLSNVIVICPGYRGLITESNGYFCFEDAHIGDYEISFEKEHYDTLMIVTDVVEEPIDVYMKMNVSSVSGTVLDFFTNEPIMGMGVYCDGCDSVTTDSNGYYLLENVPLGTVDIVFSKEWYYDERESVTVEAHKTTLLDISLKSPLIITFGRYEQDNNTSNGKEPIEWYVLDREENWWNDGKVTLLSKYALDHKVYHETEIDVTWETCSLRRWLNSTFLANAFSSSEQSMIQTTTVKGEEYKHIQSDPEEVYGNDTQDKVWLLSREEYYDYIDRTHMEDCKATAALRAYDELWEQGEQEYYCWWWLRSSLRYSYWGSPMDYCAYDVRYGAGSDSVDNVHIAVRPVIVLNLS